MGELSVVRTHHADGDPDTRRLSPPDLEDDLVVGVVDPVQVDLGGIGKGYALDVMAGELEQALARAEDTAAALGGIAATKGPEAFLADASLFLEMFAITVIAWQWLTMASAASLGLVQNKPRKKEKNFLEGKLMTARYFYTYELPKIKGLAASLETSTQMTWDLSHDCFTD